MLKGIDVSKHNGKIDWEKVKNSGIEFAIIRVGYTHYEGGLTVDELFTQNMEGAISCGIPVGVYAYAYDLSTNAAEISAEEVIKLISPYKIEYPVWYDQEYESNILALTKDVRTDICRSFMDTIQSNGYYTGLYASKDWLENKVNGSKLINYDKWVASYKYDMLEPSSDDTSGYYGSHGIWQYTVIGNIGTKGKDYWTKGSIPGISGNCDINISYKDYPYIIRSSGLNNLEKEETKTLKISEYNELIEKSNKIEEIKKIISNI